MKIGELSRLTGVEPSTIRYYERIGLLPAPRRAPNGYRLYGREAEARLQMIRTASSLGFPLGVLSRIFSGEAGGSPQRARDELSEQLRKVESRQAELAQQRQQLLGFLSLLEAGACTGRSFAACPIVPSSAVLTSDWPAI